MGIELSGPLIAVIGASAAVALTASVFGIRKLIRMGQYSYHNARLSTIGNPYVVKDELLPMVDLKDPSSLSKSLQGDLSPKEEPTSFREADRELMEAFHRSLDHLMTGSPETIVPLVRSYLHIWEIEELKRLLRLVGSRKEPLYPVGFLDEDLERQFLASKDRVQALEVLEGQRVGNAIAPLASDEDIGLDEIDSVLDRFILDELVDVSGLPLGSRKGAGYFADLMIDRYNLHYVIRAKALGWSRDDVHTHLFSKGGTIGMQLLDQMVESANVREALTVLNGTHVETFIKDSLDRGMDAIEIALDRMLLQGAVGLSHSFGSGVGPTIRFMVSKEMEMKNLRTLYQSSFSGWEPERARGMLIFEEGLS
ncbi:MAG: V-type ATPase subunit [Candidatus Thermoplasmatota archaeon]|nr:V-type ATPase subunit [Candidatus Thermoplasmatota archaeon]